MTRRGWISFAAALAVSGVAGAVAGTAASSGVTQEAFPTGCAPRQVANLVLRFLDAYNRGAADEAAAFFAPATTQDLREDAKDGELGFQWYSVGSAAGRRVAADAVDRSTLAHYFAERHAKGEQLDLLAISINYQTWLKHGIGFVFLLRRTASDLPAPPNGKIGVTWGKAGLNCPSQTMYNWSAGRYYTARPTRRLPYLPCRAPRGWRPLIGYPLVCTRARP